VRFRDRAEAGALLAERLTGWRDARPVVVALPRGGVPVGAEIAAALGAPLDVIVVRKIGHPLEPELGIGAIGEGDVVVVNRALADRTAVSDADLARTIAAERTELDRRASRYREGRGRVPVDGRTVIVVDDGLATGFTARAAIDVLRSSGASQLVLAVPVAPAETIGEGLPPGHRRRGRRAPRRSLTPHLRRAERCE
jgi:putative phosphoribosyl transferase